MTGSLAVERATVAEVGEVAALLSEAARWLRARGIEQWPDPFPERLLLPGIERGEAYLARIDGRAVATLALQWDDVPFWGEQPPVAGYLHRLAVRREAAGLGVSLVDWADAQVAAAGRRLLRLDCMADNPAIRGYYERLGFAFRRETDVGSFRAALYERPCRTSVVSPERPESAGGGLPSPERQT